MHQSRAEITTPLRGANINTPDLGCFAKFPGWDFFRKIFKSDFDIMVNHHSIYYF